MASSFKTKMPQKCLSAIYIFWAVLHAIYNFKMRVRWCIKVCPLNFRKKWIEMRPWWSGTRSTGGQERRTATGKLRYCVPVQSDPSRQAWGLRVLPATTMSSSQTSPTRPNNASNVQAMLSLTLTLRVTGDTKLFLIMELWVVAPDISFYQMWLNSNKNII